MEENLKEVKTIENVVIFILLFVILVILLPSVTSVVSKSLIVSAKTSTTGTVKMVKELYMNMNMTEDVTLPFKVVFNKNGYDIYANNKIYIPYNTYTIEHDGKLPTEGSIEIDSSGFATAKDLKFGLYKCNQIKDGDITCDT